MLAVVKLVLKAKFPTNIPVDADAMISDFLVVDMGLDQACTLNPVGSSALLDFIWARGLRNLRSTTWSVAKLLHIEPYYGQVAFSWALVQAVRRADLSMVQWLLKHLPGYRITSQVVDEAAGGGHLWLLELLEDDREIGWDISCLSTAASAGHWDLVWWLYERVDDAHLIQQRGYLIATAFKQNNVEQVEKLVAMGFRASRFFQPMDSFDDWQAHTSSLRYILQHGVGARADTHSVLRDVARFGDLAFIEWMASDMEIDSVILVSMVASEYGQLALVKWAIEHFRDPWWFRYLPGMTYSAIMGGRLQVIQWMFDNFGSHPRINIFDARFVDWRYSRMRLCPHAAVDVAACYGHLDVLKFFHDVPQAHKDHITGTTLAMDGAAAHGHYEVVKWLHKNRSEGCTALAMDTTAGAAFPRSSRDEILWEVPRSRAERLVFMQWLYANRSEGCTAAAITSAAAAGDLTMLQWLYSITSARNTRQAIDGAARHGHLHVLQWIHANGEEVFSPTALTWAASRYDIEMMEWLYGHDVNTTATEKSTVTARPEVTRSRSTLLQTHLQATKWLLARQRKDAIAPSTFYASVIRVFEVALYLHAHEPEFGTARMRNMLRSVRPSRWESTKCKPLDDWLEEHYPLHSEFTGH